MNNHNARIVALDVGEKRIGVASANVVARLAAPLMTLEASDDINQVIKRVLAEQTAAALVIGLPRNLNSDDTAQTRVVREFAARLEKEIDIPIYLQDEALTSHVSEEKLKKTKVSYDKAAIDAMAASQILEDFLISNQEIPA